jgi:hypothetical protein
MHRPMPRSIPTGTLDKILEADEESARTAANRVISRFIAAPAVLVAVGIVLAFDGGPVGWTEGLSIGILAWVVAGIWIVVIMRGWRRRRPIR